MNLVHLAGCDGTDPDSLTRFEIEGRRQALLAIEALRRYTPGCRTARLRNFGDDHRDPRHPEDRRRLLSVRTGQPFHELDSGLVQAELDRQGVRHQ